jgi:ABC-type multidrug transport system ATPase subunit
MDPGSRTRLSDFISDFRARGRGVILATHDRDFAAESCQRLAVLKGGRIAFQGDLESAMKRYPQTRSQQYLALKMLQGVGK